MAGAILRTVVAATLGPAILCCSLLTSVEDLSSGPLPSRPDSASDSARDTDSPSDAGVTSTNPSCRDVAPTCGASGSGDCCASTRIEGGSFLRNYDGVSSEKDCPDCTKPDFMATVSDFRLDSYEVTVGRFRSFVNAVVSGWSVSLGSGKHSHLNSGAGLNGGTEPGWTMPSAPLPSALANWNTNLACDSLATWREKTGPEDNLPINCVAWQEAAAFCIWDEGFLPSDAEWNYAAAGGSEQRVFPWSKPPASMTADKTFASYGCGDSCTPSDIHAVGSLSKGAGRWGQSEMGGNLFEWNLDWASDPPKVCHDCASVTTPCSDCKKNMRGGSFVADLTFVHAASVGQSSDATHRDRSVGFRCARAP